MGTVAVSKRDVGQSMTRIDLDKRQVGLLVAPNHLGGVFVAIRQGDRYLARAVNDMVVRDDVALRIDYEAAAQRSLFWHPQATTLLPKVAAQHVAKRSLQIGDVGRLL